MTTAFENENAHTAEPAGADPVPAAPVRAASEPQSTAAPRRFEALRAAAPGWVVGHLLVILVAWHHSPKHPLAALLDWDSVWYRWIAGRGYGDGSLIHFFPLTPAGAALLRLVTRIPVTEALFGFCWIAALVFGAALYRLTLLETGDRGAARRSAWLIQLAPGAYALVMGYTEPLAGLLAVLYFLFLRSVAARGGDEAQNEARGDDGTRDDLWGMLLRRHGLWPAALVGLLGGISRPTGIVLALAGAIEGWRIARASGWRPATTVQAAAAAVAPALGLFAFLAYSRVNYGSWTLPLSQQVIKTNRGALVNDPRTSLHLWLHGAGRGNHGHQVAAMCVLLIVTAALLILAVAWKLPWSYLVWTVPSYLLAITSHSFTSLPRYIGALFPIVMVLAMLTRRRWQFWAVLAVSAGLLIWTSHITFSLWLVA
jgi:hypothetical protein